MRTKVTNPPLWELQAKTAKTQSMGLKIRQKGAGGSFPSPLVSLFQGKTLQAQFKQLLYYNNGILSMTPINVRTHLSCTNPGQQEMRDPAKVQ